MSRASLPVLALCLGLLAGCGPIYVAPSANAPLFGSGGELHGQIQFESLGGVDLHGAFSPFNHVGLQAGVSFLPWFDEDDEDRNRYYYGEVGAGAYIPFGIGRFEVFAGGGYGKSWGKLESDENGTRYYGDGEYGRVYVQADIGLSTKIVDFCLMNRWSWVTMEFFDGSTTQKVQDPFVEEMLVFRVGYDPVKFEMQGGFVWASQPLQHVQVGWIPWHISIGLHIKFDLWGRADDVEEAPPAANDGDDGWKSQNIVSRLW